MFRFGSWEMGWKCVSVCVPGSCVTFGRLLLHGNNEIAGVSFGFETELRRNMTLST